MRQLHRTCAAILALVMLVCLCPAGLSITADAATASADTLTANDGRIIAYRQVLQNIVDEYGILNVTDPGEYDSSSGLMEAFFADMTGDGAEELCVFYVAPYTYSNGYSETSIFTKIYTYENHSAVEIYDTSDSIYSVYTFHAYTDGSTPYFVTGCVRNYTVVYCWRGGKFVTADDFSDEEETLIFQAALEGGARGENDMREKISAEKLGISLENDNVHLGGFMFETTSTYSSDSAINFLTSIGVKMPMSIYLDNIPYIGDRSKCKMTDEMAKAYADAINSHPCGAFDQRREVLLIDHADDGMPLLFIADYNYNIQSGVWYALFTWDGTAAVEFELKGQINSSFGFGYYNGEPVFISEFYGDSPDSSYSGKHIYRIDNADFKLMATRTSYGAYSYDGITAYAEDLPLVNAEYSASVSSLLNAGWIQNGNSLYIDFVDGNPKFFSNIEDRNVWLAELKETYSFGRFYGYLNYDNSNAAAGVLYAYADAYSDYSYPKIIEADDTETVKGIAEAVAKVVGGEITAIYKLADGVYYVVITVNGSEKGAVVRGYMNGGVVAWKVSETHETPETEENLNAVINNIISTSNISLDYGKIGSLDADKIADYLGGCLDNMDGLTPTDASKSELASFIESAISAACSGSVSGKDNRLDLSAAAVKELAEKAKQTQAEVETLLFDRGITLNKSLTVMIRILWQDMDKGSPCQITLNKDVLDSMNGCVLQILVGDAQHYIQISESNLRTLIDELGSVTVQLSRDSDGSYTINFLDESGTVIDKLSLPVSVGLPAESATSTIMASYSGGSDNWGGQYDDAAKIISFDASYSGRYEVLENSVEITDISTLDEETRTAIAFLVSKGYMTLEDGAFRPDSALTRYHFSKALVGMFFALDRELTLSFPDVPVDSPYYAYVASAAEKSIILGYDDGMFHGDNEITTEQMLALAARTLIDYKGYALPTDPDSYLGAFDDGGDVSDWAKQQVALAIREGLVDRGGELDPIGNVTREEAALILYRLFLLLHEVPAVALELPPVSETTSIVPAIIGGEGQGFPAAVIAAAFAAITVVAIVGVVVTVLVLKKRKK